MGESTSSFDPYHQWLGIPAKDQPPHHYRLLGVEPFEEDLAVIETAADKQMLLLRSLQNGPRGAKSQELLNEVSSAKVILLNSARKAAYDRTLRRELKNTQTTEPRKPLPKALPIQKPEDEGAGDLPDLQVEPQPQFSRLQPDLQPRPHKPLWERPRVRRRAAQAGVAVAMLIIVYGIALQVDWDGFSQAVDEISDVEKELISPHPETSSREGINPSSNPQAMNDVASIPETQTAIARSQPAPANLELPIEAPPVELVVVNVADDSVEAPPTEPAVVDLLALIDPQRHSTRGGWTREGEAIIGPTDGDDVLHVQYELPVEFDLQLRCQKTGGRWTSNSIGVVGGSQQFVYVFNPTFPGNRTNRGSAIQFIGKKWHENPTTSTKGWLSDREPCDYIISVRKAGVAVAWNGEPIILWD